MNKHKKLALILTISLSLVFVIALKTQAGVGEAIVGGVLENTIDIILRFLAILVALGGKLFDWVIGITKFTDITAVTVGWGIIRDFVNVSFIFVLLIIAISTILGVNKQYGIESLFVNLVICALLVNFSMLFCNLIIDATNLVTNFFIEPFRSGGVLGISNNIMSGLGVAKIYQASIGSGFWETSGSVLISMLMSIIVMIGAVLAIWLATGLLMVRVLVLSFLIILAPAAFLCRILPNTKDLWAKWWKTFINYCLFAPCFAFFLYLALLTAQKSVGSAMVTSSGTFSGLPQAGNSFFSIGDTVVHYVIFLGLLFGAMLMGKHFSVYGGAKVYSMGSGAVKGLAKKMTGYGSAEQAIKAYKAARTKGKEAGAAAKFGTRLSYMRDAAVGAMLPGRLGKKTRKRANNARVNFLAEGYEGDSIADLETVFLTGSPAQKAGAAKAFIKAGYVRNLTFPTTLAGMPFSDQKQLLNHLGKIITNYTG